MPLNKSCGNCAYYITDTDDAGNVSGFHHDNTATEGFCAIRDLFYSVTRDDSACADWLQDSKA